MPSRILAGPCNPHSSRKAKRVSASQRGLRLGFPQSPRAGGVAESLRSHLGASATTQAPLLSLETSLQTLNPVTCQALQKTLKG